MNVYADGLSPSGDEMAKRRVKGPHALPDLPEAKGEEGVGRLSRGKMALFIAAASSGRREGSGVLDTTAKNGHRSVGAEAIPKSERVSEWLSRLPLHSSLTTKVPFLRRRVAEADNKISGRTTEDEWGRKKRTR